MSELMSELTKGKRFRLDGRLYEMDSDFHASPVTGGKEYEISRGGVTVKFGGLDDTPSAIGIDAASATAEELKKAAMEAMKKSRISSIKVDTEPFPVSDESDTARIHDLLYGGWSSDHSATITVDPTERTTKIRRYDPISSVERYSEEKEELGYYKEKYHSWFPDKKLNKDSFKNLPSDLSKEIMGTFCVDMVWDLFNRIFKAAIEYSENRLASDSLSQFIEVRRMVDRAVKRFKLDRKQMASLLRRVIVEATEFYIDKDKDWLGHLFFGMSEERFKEIVDSKYFLVNVTYKGEDYTLYVAASIKKLTGIEDDDLETITASF